MGGRSREPPAAFIEVALPLRGSAKTCQLNLKLLSQFSRIV